MRAVTPCFKFFFLASLVIVFCLYSKGHATDGTWAGATATWATVINWSSNPNPVPGPADTATFTGAGNPTVNMAGTTLDTLSITGGPHIYDTGVGALTPTTISISSGAATTFNATSLGGGDLTNTGNGTVVFAGANTVGSLTQNSATGITSLNANVTSAGINTLTKGTIDGTGTLTGNLIQDGGTLNGTVTVTGNLTQNAGAVSGGVSVNSNVTQGGGTFGGSGTVGGTFTQNGGVLNGNVTVTGVLTQNSGTVGGAVTTTTNVIQNGGIYGGTTGTVGRTFTQNGGTLNGTVTITGVLTQNSGTVGGAVATTTNVIQTGGTYGGTGTVGGTFTKSGGKLNGAVAVAGNTILNAGTIGGSVNLGAALTQAAGTVRGAITVVGAFTQSGGVISPASTETIGTINLGSYVQNVRGTYTTTIDSAGNSDTLAVTGNVTLNGTVNLEPIAGIYAKGTQYTLITSGGITANSATLTQSKPLPSRVFTQGNNINLTVLENTIVLPVNIELLPINSQRVADYLYENVAPSGPLRQLTLTTLGSPAGVFADTLLQLSPVQFGAFALVGLQNNVHMANVLSRRAVNTLCNDPECDSNYRQMWAEPIGLYYHQKPHNRQRGFDDYTYGAAYGMEFPLGKYISLGGSLGYTHSGIIWYPDFGRAHSNTIYTAFNIGLSQHLSEESASIGFINLLIQGDIDFYKCKRNIHIPNFTRVADSNHNSYNLLGRVDTGVKISADHSETFFIQPEAQINYLNLFEVGYKEIGAGLANLKVNNKHSVYLQPNAKVRFIAQFENKDLCYTPNVYLGWLANVPITSGLYTAHMYNIITSEKEFSVTSYHEYANQLVIGGEFSVTKCKNFLLNVGYEGDLLNHFGVQALTIRMEWAY